MIGRISDLCTRAMNAAMNAAANLESSTTNNALVSLHVKHGGEAMPPKQAIEVRWMLRRDLPRLAAIDEDSHPYCGLTAAEIETLARRRDIIVFVAEQATVPVGFMMVSMTPAKYSVEKLVVDPSRRRRGVGRTLIEYLTSRIVSHRRRYVEILVHESETDAHLFLRACGIRAEMVLRDQYRFVWRPVRR